MRWIAIANKMKQLIKLKSIWGMNITAGMQVTDTQTIDLKSGFEKCI